jgi:GcrA cell cycle regulator
MRCQEWTSERLELLTRLWAEGETAVAIGEQLGGLTRSAVLGKVFRLRRANAAAAPAAKKQRHPDQGLAGSSTVSRVEAGPTRRHRRPTFAGQPRPAPRLTQPRGKSRGKSLLELTNLCCRWPHGRPGTKTFFFCGAEGADLERGMPYCPQHAQRAYVGGEGNNNPPSVTWSTLRAVFAPNFDPTQQRVAAGGSRS